MADNRDVRACRKASSGALIVSGQNGVPPLPESLTGRIWIRYCVLKFLFRSGVGYVRNSLANAIKQAMGREPYLDKTEIFFRDYLLAKLDLRPPPKITALGDPDVGVGNQVRFIMCAINFARAMRVPYVHTPFQVIEHADRPMEEWAKLWESEFNLGVGELDAQADPDELLDFTRLAGPIAKRFGHANVFAMFDFTAGEFQRKYYLDKERRHNPLLSLAVHVRRGDSTPSNKIGRWTEMTDVASTVRQVKALLSAHGIAHRTSIFSQGDPGDFRELADLGAELFLNRDVVWTMREMIEADVFIMGKGWYSYIAALISDGLRLYDPWLDVPPLKEWLVLRPDGSFDESRFARQLMRKIPGES